MGITKSEINSKPATSEGTPLRFITAASLFDGHDAAINIMRRILQSSGAEVIHLAHNRSVREVITSALQEDVDGIAISSYQGGHIEYFKYMVATQNSARTASRKPKAASGMPSGAPTTLRDTATPATISARPSSAQIMRPVMLRTSVTTFQMA